MGGNASIGASNPDKNKKGPPTNLSRAVAFSVQKHNAEIIQCIKKPIRKANQVEISVKIKTCKDGIQNELGLIIKKIKIIPITNGNLANCSAICVEKYLHIGWIGWIIKDDNLPFRRSTSKALTTQTIENCLTIKVPKKYLSRSLSE